MSNRTVLRAGLRQVRTELRIQLFSPLVLAALLGPVIGLAVIWFFRDTTLMQTAISSGQYLLPAFIAFGVVSGAVIGVAGEMMTEREDGTLLRAKAVPHGMAGHLVGKVLLHSALTLVPIAVLLVGASFMVDGVTPSNAAGWARLALVALLSMTATLPLGAVLGALFRSPLSMLWVTMAVYGLAAVSGIFYPLSALPSWLQGLAQAFPVYWMGLGVRSALLPPEAATLEIGESWRTLETLAVLGLWSGLGLVLAPVVLRRMARRQSGSAVAAARDRVMARGY